MVSFCCDGTSAPHMTSVRCVRVNTKVYETVCVKDKDVFIYVCVCACRRHKDINSSLPRLLTHQRLMEMMSSEHFLPMPLRQEPGSDAAY